MWYIKKWEITKKEKEHITQKRFLTWEKLEECMLKKTDWFSLKAMQRQWGLKGFSGIKKLFSGIIWKRNIKNSKMMPKAFFILSVFIFDCVKLRLCSADSPCIWADFIWYVQKGPSDFQHSVLKEQFKSQ